MLESQAFDRDLMLRWLGTARTESFERQLQRTPVVDISIHNQRIAAALMEDISHCELALRNCLDFRLQERLTALDVADSWLTDPTKELEKFGGEGMNRKILAARRNVMLQKKLAVQEDVLAELSMGFWVELMSKRLLPVNVDLREAFEGLKGRDVRKLNWDLTQLKNLRNRVAHHHRVIHRDLLADYSLILKVAKLIHPQLAKLIAITSRTPGLIEEFTQITQAKSFSMPREPH
jgi:hypothetical protein